MTPEKQRIAIAEACGWIHQPIIEKAGWGCSAVFPHYTYAHQLPNYLNDLNAIHEAEKALMDQQWVQYRDNLRTVVLGPVRLVSQWLKADIHATASQRAEAFLRTLNLWTEG